MFDDVQFLTKIPVRARLLDFVQEWFHLILDSFVKSTVTEGCQIELLSQPLLSTNPIPITNSEIQDQVLGRQTDSGVNNIPMPVTRVLQPYLFGAQERRGW